MTRDIDYSTGEILIIDSTEEAYEITPVGLAIKRPLSYEEWMECGSKLVGIINAARWCIGDWLIYGEKQKWGHKYDKYTQALDAKLISYSTLSNCVRVSHSFSFRRRRRNLSWSHHYETLVLKEESEQDRVLDLAIKGDWGREDLREYIKALLRKIETPALPLGTYNVIYADPPWEYRNSGLNGAAERHYPTMPLEQICDLLTDIRLEVDDNATLFLWATSPMLRDALTVMESWGFDYKACMVWTKDKATYGKLGFYLRTQHELLLIGTRGQFIPETMPVSVITAPRGEHSAKPEAFREIVEQMYPRQRFIELFARNATTREGWTFWGNEANADS